MPTLDDTAMQQQSDIPPDVVRLEEVLLAALCNFFRPYHPNINTHWQKFLFAPWVHFFVHGTYDRWIRAKNSGELAPQFFPMKANLRPPGDTGSFLELNRTSEYKNYIDAFLRGFKLNFSCEERMQRYDIKYSNDTNCLGFKTFFSKTAQWMLQLLSFGKFKIINNNPKLVSIICNQTLRIEFSYFIKNEIEKNYKKNQEWISILTAAFFPLSIFEFLINKPFDKYSNKACKKLFSVNAWIASDDWKIFAVKNKLLNNSKLIGVPHALNHMISKNYWERDFELIYLDEYHLWGKGRIRDDSISHIGYNKNPYSLAQFSSTIKPRSNSNVIISSAARPTHLVEYPYQPENFEIYLNNQLNLASQIQKITKNRIVIRSRPRDLGWNLSSKVKNLNNEMIELRFENNRFLKELKNYNLHICDNISTTINDSLGANFPTMILISKDYFNLSIFAEDNFKFLKESGIFHENIDSLMSHISIVHEDFDAWWSSSKVQKSKQKFLDLYNSKNNGILSWLKLLNGGN